MDALLLSLQDGNQKDFPLSFSDTGVQIPDSSIQKTERHIQTNKNLGSLLISIDVRKYASIVHIYGHLLVMKLS